MRSAFLVLVLIAPAAQEAPTPVIPFRVLGVYGNAGVSDRPHLVVIREEKLLRDLEPRVTKTDFAVIDPAALKDEAFLFVGSGWKNSDGWETVVVRAMSGGTPPPASTRDPRASP